MISWVIARLASTRASLAAFLVLAAASVGAGKAARPQPALPARHLRVPLVRQATSYSCGAAVMLSVLYYWNAFDGAESDLYADLKTTPGYGTDSRNMASAAPRWGLSATLREGMTLVDLEAALAKGDTVIIDLQAWPKKKQPGPRWEQLWEDGHYVVLVAMDSRYVYVMDPAVRAGYAYIPREELYARWHDYEDSGGSVWKNERLGIVIRGNTPISSYPAKLTRVD